MRKSTFRLGAKPSSSYLERFDERDVHIASGEPSAYARVGEGDLEFEVHIPVEFGAVRSDLFQRARSALEQMVAMDDAARASNHNSEEDGYVWLSADGRPGLGAHLYEALARRVPVIGVAKTRFHDDAWSQPVRRGASEAPLYVTAAGVDHSDAARCIARMSGRARIPTLLRQVDEFARAALR